MDKVALGVDIGGTEVKIGLITSSGKILEKQKFQHRVPSEPDKIINQLYKEIKQMKFWNNKKIVNLLTGIGIGSAGDINQTEGIIRFSTNFGWKNVYIKKLLQNKFNIPIIVDNDANAACWGSFCLEFKNKINNLVCFTLGTGVGGGIVINNKLYRGTTGSAGELGHVTLYPDGRKCSCGNYGCLERYIGAYDLINDVKNKIISGEKTVITKLIKNNLNLLSPELVYKAACINDEFARQVWTDFGKQLGIVVASIVNILNPELIVLTGGVADAYKFFIDIVRDTVKKRAFKTPSENLKIVVSKLGKNLGIIGAACLVLFPSYD